MRRLALVAVAVALAAPVAARATTETATLGATSATFTYKKVHYRYTGMTVAIARGGTVAYQGVATSPQCQPSFCWPELATAFRPSLRVVDLDGDGEPEVIVDVSTHGAHCCTIANVYRWTGTTYAEAIRNFADFGYTLDGGVFTTGDHRFAYAFASFADSVFPVRLLTFGAGGWRDVTRTHPDTLTADAARWLKYYKQHRDGTRSLGLLAAWAADEYRLGRAHAADTYMSAELRAGRLKGDRHWPRGKAFISTLHRRLRAWGYT